ncbi:MAG: cation:proton antiporter [Steroidobacteraceae bacterium]|jgi:hypothetical protein|nr:cation:proton antiporter [Steroidobacteraceae bacterium]
MVTESSDLTLGYTVALLAVATGTAPASDRPGWLAIPIAMAALLAGVLLSESTFRHQLEADVEPFRSILLGLFFLRVGMSLDLATVAREWSLVVGGVAGLMAVKALGIYGVARLFGADHRESLARAALFAQGDEVLKGLGFDTREAAETVEDVRRRDFERLELQIVGGITAGRSLLRGNLVTPQPAPLTVPTRESAARRGAAAPEAHSVATRAAKQDQRGGGLP